LIFDNPGAGSLLVARSKRVVETVCSFIDGMERKPRREKKMKQILRGNDAIKIRRKNDSGSTSRDMIDLSERGVADMDIIS